METIYPLLSHVSTWWMSLNQSTSGSFSRAIEWTLAHPHHSVAALALLSGVLWITSRLLTRPRPDMVTRQIAEADAARKEARR